MNTTTVPECQTLALKNSASESRKLTPQETNPVRPVPPDGFFEKLLQGADQSTEVGRRHRFLIHEYHAAVSVARRAQGGLNQMRVYALSNTMHTSPSPGTEASCRAFLALANPREASYLSAMESPDYQLRQYIPVLILGIVAVSFSVVTLVASVLLGKRGRNSRVKDMAYECGMLPVGEGNTRLSVKFYLVAMLFILFDIEVVFLYPWAVNFRAMLAQQPGLIFGSMIAFMLILFIGYLYALKKEAFEWRK
jgi:NADH-quinone oxidoreductase subunit A